jgi:putative ABC transport system substrate-binding protein
MDRRRFLLTSLAGAFAAPLGVEAQPAARTARIGVLSSFTASDAAPWHSAFRQGLHDLGWVDERNVSFDYRYAEGRTERLADLAAELVRLKVDVIVTSVTPDTLAAKKATAKIPIVMASVGDPIATGIVPSLARPGGNITGLSQIAPELQGKRLQLLKEIVPTLSRVGVLRSPQSQSSAAVFDWKEMQLPARELGMQLHALEVRTHDDLDGAFEGATKARDGAVVILPGVFAVANRERIAQLAIRHRLPSISHLSAFVDAGGLMAYGPDRADLFRRAATYVDKILKGAKPAELPVEQPTKFDLVINLKTAKALGITIPPSLLLRADHVIE